MYWSVLHGIERFPQEQEAYALIQQATESPNPGTRKWCCLLLGRRRNLDDLPFFLKRLQDDISEVRYQSLQGISMLLQDYSFPQVLPEVIPLLHDKDERIREIAREVQTILLQRK